MIPASVGGSATTLLGAGVAVGAVASLVLLLYAIIRFSIVSPRRTRGWKRRLRHPETEGVHGVSGFQPSPDLIAFYRQAPFIELVEFYLVDRSKKPAVEWPVGAFNPLTPVDVREQMKISGVAGIPIADDLDKGTYFVTDTGAVMLHSPDVAGGVVEVAPSIAAFGRFEVSERPPGL